MQTLSNPRLGAFILRLSLGIVMIAHSLYLKLFIFTLAGTAQFFTSIGLPAALAYAVFISEALGGIALIIGFKTRYVSVFLVPILLGATWAHWQNGWLFTNQGGGWEYPLVLTVMAIAQAFLGGGRWSMDQRTAMTQSEA